MQRAAVVYFSQTGVTANAATEIQRVLGGPLVELHRQPAYPENYSELVQIADKERTAHLLPTLMPLTTTLSDVTTIFLGFPTWWSQPPLIINQFFATTDLRGKTIVPFTTSVSSLIDESMGTLRSLAKKAGATLAPGLTANSREDTQNFIRQYQ
ncbi:flavodoxin [Levilactobacillus namurensis]|uniref:flavodoxin n=1 Tax=Levilactobacillus namurensis TaxID=380393 RepID=UPI000465E5C9|nr:flavodoxin [Levilactobacillus namurensis]